VLLDGYANAFNFDDSKPTEHQVKVLAVFVVALTAVCGSCLQRPPFFFTPHHMAHLTTTTTN
jgi:hypothetical protein